MRRTNPPAPGDQPLDAVYRMGVSEASPWLVPGTILLFWFLGWLARDEVSTTRLTVWLVGSVACAVLRYVLIEQFGDEGRYVRTVGMSCVFGAWLAWYWIGVAPIADAVPAAAALLGVTTWWTASTALLAGNPTAFTALSTFIVGGMVGGVALRESPFRGSGWMVLLLAAAISVTYVDRRGAYLTALRSDRAVRQLAAEFSLLFESVPDGVLVTAGGVIERVNPPMAAQLRTEVDALVGRRFAEILDRPLDELLEVPAARVEVIRPDRSMAVLELTGRASAVEDLVVWSSRDVTDAVAREAAWLDLIDRDDLTGLANRRALFDRLDGLHRERRPVAVLAVDVDDFKAVNDRLGHAVGDDVLTSVGAVLEEGVGDEGMVARIGGDEFVIVLTAPAAVAEPERVAAAVVDRCREPLPLEGDDLRVTISVGVSTSDGSDPPDVTLQAADLAMYQVKRQGRDGWWSRAPAAATDEAAPEPDDRSRFRRPVADHP